MLAGYERTMNHLPTPLLRAAGAAAGLALLAACGGGSSSSTPVATATPCTDTTNATLTLVSPSPSQSGVSTSTTSVSVQASAPIPGTVELELYDTTSGSTQVGGQITGSNPYSAAGFTLAAGQSYTVYLLNTSQPGCTAQAIPGATFST